MGGMNITAAMTVASLDVHVFIRVASFSVDHIYIPGSLVDLDNMVSSWGEREMS